MNSERQAVEDRAFLQMAREHYENFPVGSWLLPAASRLHLHRIYAFARTADDIADELRDATALAEFRTCFTEHLAKTAAPTEPMFVDLVASIEQLDLPTQLFYDLLDAFQQDLTVSRYSDAELLDYCRRSADPVGRLVLRVSGYDDPELDVMSDAICTGLQLVNHLQDIAEDLRDRDRIYFPREDLERFGVSEEALRAERASSEVRALVRHWTDRIAAMFRTGWPLTAAVRGRLRAELRAIVGGAAAVLTAIRAADHDVLSRHLRLGKAAKVGIVSRALLSRRPPKAIR